MVIAEDGIFIFAANFSDQPHMRSRSSGTCAMCETRAALQALALDGCGQRYNLLARPCPYLARVRLADACDRFEKFGLAIAGHTGDADDFTGADIQRTTSSTHAFDARALST